MNYEHSAAGALKGYKWASRAASALKYAHYAAMGCAAASLVLGGIRIARQFRAE